MEESPLIIPELVGSNSEVPEADPQTQTNYDSQMPSSDEEETLRYPYRHEPTTFRRIKGRHLFPHPGHAYPLINAKAMLNIDCVTSTDEVIKD